MNTSPPRGRAEQVAGAGDDQRGEQQAVDQRLEEPQERQLEQEEADVAAEDRVDDRLGRRERDAVRPQHQRLPRARHGARDAEREQHGDPGDDPRAERDDVRDVLGVEVKLSRRPRTAHAGAPNAPYGLPVAGAARCARPGAGRRQAAGDVPQPARPLRIRAAAEAVREQEVAQQDDQGEQPAPMNSQTWTLRRVQNTLSNPTLRYQMASVPRSMPEARSTSRATIAMTIAIPATRRMIVPIDGGPAPSSGPPTGRAPGFARAACSTGAGAGATEASGVGGVRPRRSGRASASSPSASPSVPRRPRSAASSRRPSRRPRRPSASSGGPSSSPSCGRLALSSGAPGPRPRRVGARARA